MEFWQEKGHFSDNWENLNIDEILHGIREQLLIFLGVINVL